MAKLLTLPWIKIQHGGIYAITMLAVGYVTKHMTEMNTAAAEQYLGTLEPKDVVR